jgi:membrane associated rhomboid family serine protease
MKPDKDFHQIISSFIPGMLAVALLWCVKWYEVENMRSLSEYGLFPRRWDGFIGIFTMPFLHGDLEHLISNSVPLLVLLSGLVYFYKKLAFRVTLWIWLLSGFWLWLGGRSSYHIGASAVIYGLTVFLFFSGVFRKDRRLMALSLLVVFLYGGLVWGMLPVVEELSWEGHLFGSCAGLLMAIVYKKQGPQRPPYSWELDNDADVEDGPEAYWRTTESNPLHKEP